ncbi:hypothetical protein FY036_10650 [Mesorhizobium microcysteis]|uniref:Uncharacterized protein n=1 Tax=Neoaquamicrobium microcysteis TaxID=2682781 RepID=A0A5D4GTR8_9HYPH|nr:hypothetical protein [Mesorhizobium microcysteis]TYR32271.1 hypothetical protein FY036_10650 [Mesorhizobium microcysteis]
MAKKNEQNEVETATDVEAIENATTKSVTEVTGDADVTGDAQSPEVQAEAEAGTPPEAAPEVGAAATTEAGADPATEAVAAAMGDVVAKKQSRKAKLKSSAARDEAAAAAAPDYAAYGLSEDEAQAVEALRLAYTELGRRSTEHVFECGAVMDAVHQIAPDQKTFGKLVKGAFGICRTGAENLARVHRNLREHRARLARLGIAASSLYVMATAETDKVEEVLVAAEAGGKLSVKRVKAMLGTPVPIAVVPDDGGPEGLRAAVAEKTGYASKVFFETVVRMLRAVHIFLEPHREGRLVHDARLASGLFKSLVYAAQVPGDPYGAGIIHVLPVAENRWVRTERVLYDMGSDQSWPKSEKVGTWLEQKVLPELEWAVGTERAEKAKAVLEERAAAAEAERVKAEQAKERAKADAKKAREKAKRDKAKAEKQALREARAAAKGATAANDAAVDGNADA